MAFDCVYAGQPLDRAAHLTRDAIADGARDHGLQSVYHVTSVEIVPRRWRRQLVDIVVHVADGDDILGMQFPDEAREAIDAAVSALLRAPRAAVQGARAADSPRGSPVPAASGAIPRAS